MFKDAVYLGLLVAIFGITSSCQSIDVNPTNLSTSLATSYLSAKWDAMSDDEKQHYCSSCPGCCSSPERKREIEQIREERARWRPVILP